MKHLVSLHVEVHSIAFSCTHGDPSWSPFELQEMPCLESMTWTSSEGTFPAALHRLARTLKKKDKLKGYMIEDSSGVYVAA
ncbi:hypothetical protein WJX77_003169 [Trebouxia sp. C0004]